MLNGVERSVFIGLLILCSFIWANFVSWKFFDTNSMLIETGNYKDFLIKISENLINDVCILILSCSFLSFLEKEL